MTKSHTGGRLGKIATLGTIAAVGYYFYASKDAQKHRKDAAQRTRTMSRGRRHYHL